MFVMVMVFVLTIRCMFGLMLMVRLMCAEDGNEYTYENKERTECRFAIRLEERTERGDFGTEDKNESKQSVGEAFAEDVKQTVPQQCSSTTEVG